jgi:cell wall-associated protease
MRTLIGFLAALMVVFSLYGGHAAASGLRSLQWDHRAIHVKQAWVNVPTMGSLSRVCVVDTGAPGKNVTDLSGSVVDSINFADPLHPNRTRDDFSHGTFVSGQIAAHGTLMGVAPKAKLLEAKVMNALGEGDTGGISGGILWCVSQGANVINMSLGGGDGDHNAMKQALHYACQHDVAIAVSSGNDALTAPGDSPADFIHNRCLIAVNSMDRSGWISSYSNVLQNPKSVTAPGGNIVGLSTSGGVSIESGTSMAAPLVAGVMALLHDEGYNAQDSVKRILATAAAPPKIPAGEDVLSPSHVEGAYGAGILDAAAATAHQ